MSKKLLLLLLCAACFLQPISMDAFSRRWMRRTFSSRSVKMWGALAACAMVGLAAYAFMEQGRENNPEKNHFLNPKRRNSVIGLSDFEDNDEVEIDSGEPEVLQSKIVRTPLITALLRNNAKGVKTIAKKSDINEPDSTGKTPLMYAIKDYSRATFGPIWNRKPNLQPRDTTGKDWMLHAIESDLNTRVFRTILAASKNGAVVDNQEQTALMYLARKNRVELIPDIIDKGVDLDAQDAHGKTAIHHAIENASHNCFDSLLGYDDVDINLSDIDGKTPLITALINGHNGFAEQLLNCEDIQVNHMDSNNHSALYYAIQMDRLEIVESIIQKNPHISDAALNLAFNNNNQQILAAVNNAVLE